jgi:hypothetical protein
MLLVEEPVVVGDDELGLFGAGFGLPYCPNATGREKRRERMIGCIALPKFGD